MMEYDDIEFDLPANDGMTLRWAVSTCLVLGLWYSRDASLPRDLLRRLKPVEKGMCIR